MGPSNGVGEQFAPRKTNKCLKWVHAKHCFTLHLAQANFLTCPFTKNPENQIFS
jgi:hypothetical protein